jgi:hypothetical protein
MAFYKTLVNAVVFGTVLSSAQPVKRTSGQFDNAELITKLKTDASRAEQFDDLFLDGTELLSHKELKDATIFDFNKQYEVPGSGTSSAVRRAAIYIKDRF